LLIGLIVVVAMLPRVAFLARPFESDAGLYIYMGKALAGGQTLYHDFYETKLPGVPLMTAGLYRLFGDHWWPYVTLQALMSLIAAGLLARSAARMSRMATVEIPTFLFALIFLNFSFVAYRGFQLETVQTFFASIAATFGIKSLSRNRRRYAFLVGLFAGSAAMIKPTGVAVAGAFALTRIIQLKPKWFLDLMLLALGILFVPADVLAWTWRAGLLGDMPALLREITLYASQTPLMWDDLLKPLCAIIVGGFAFAIASVFRRRAIVESAEYFDFERIEALKPAIEACGISTLSQSPMLGFHKQMDNRINLLEEILSFRMQGVEFDNGDMYVDGHKAASDVRDEFVSVTEKL